MKVSCVFKVGGSLLEPPEFPELPERLDAFLDSHGGERPLGLVGGGPTVDLIRGWDRTHDLGEEASHWISVQALSINALVLQGIAPRLEAVETESACEEAWNRRRVPLYDPYRFLKDIDDRRKDPLPRRWSVTTDSIAARMAEQFEAQDLALLKSSSPGKSVNLSVLALAGYVDKYFKEAVKNLTRITVYNLRVDPTRAYHLEG